MTYTEKQYNDMLTETAEALQQKEAEIAEIKAERDGVKALLASATAAFDAGDSEALLALRENAKKTEKEKAIEVAKAEIDAATKRLAELSE